MIATFLTSLLLLQGAPYVPPGAVSGQLRTLSGDPAINVRIVAVKLPGATSTPDDNLNYFDIYFERSTNYTLTDNEGNYRLQELAPGRYFILAGASGMGKGTYYPDSLEMKGAEVLNIESGVELDHLDFQLKVRLGGRISGRVKADMSGLGTRRATITGGALEDLLEVPVQADGTFSFGHLPPGKYLLSLYPPTPGIASMPITVANDDISGAELEPLPTNKVSGRIVVRNGAIPHGLLGFFTEKTWVVGKINDDGTFAVDLHSARHGIDFAGLPVGYTVASVRAGSQDVTEEGITVSSADVSNVVITLNAPKNLAVVKGTIAGLAQDRYAATAVVLTGPTFNKLQADVQPDGTYRFDAVVPGLYRMTLSNVPELPALTVVIDGFGTFDVPVNVPVR